ncbi:MAG: hypothetical protein A3J72_05820 [Nitrospirae bacterium RIFCSPHIGHO2_02_FULL_40_19]|nr:MAG: hypothetical protein A3J72_05820 [Nitrospirae bacterium RIFCSPHIGHO2_02_FULL_40_19]
MKILLSLISLIFIMNLPESFSSMAKGKDIEGMVFIKGGCYQMGDTFGDGEGDEKPVHEVCVDDFYMGETEVTQRQWTKIMGSNPSRFKGCNNCPVESVSWNDVQEFINKLNTKSPRPHLEKGDKRGFYRLPTEAEWEYAARSGGKREKFAGFSEASELYQYANFCDSNCKFDWKEENQNDGYKNTSPVKQYKPNGVGLYDMTGNVWEWCSDWYGHHNINLKNNPKGADSGLYKVLRGGAWNNIPWQMRASSRNGYEQSDRNTNLGIRLTLSAMQ